MTIRRHNLLGRARRDERGTTLIEVMLAATIMGIAFIGLMSMLWTLLATTLSHRQTVRAGLVATQVAESLEGASYVDCGTPASYVSSLSTGTGYVATIDSVTYLADATATAPSFVVSCPATDQGTQQVTVKVVIDTSITGGGAVSRTEFVEYTLRDDDCPTYYPTVPGDTC